MDSTIIGVECIDELADFAGVKTEVAAITERADARRARLRGRADRPCRAAEGPARGGARSAATTSASASIPARAPSCAPWPRSAPRPRSSRAASPSSPSVSPRRPASPATRPTRLVVEDGRLTGEVARPILGREAKLAALAGRRPARSASLPRRCSRSATGPTTSTMIGAAGLGVAYHAKPALAAVAECPDRALGPDGAACAAGYPGA